MTDQKEKAGQCANTDQPDASPTEMTVKREPLRVELDADAYRAEIHELFVQAMTTADTWTRSAVRLEAALRDFDTRRAAYEAAESGKGDGGAK